ncbi:MAG: hypothetical protein ACFCU1_07500 [Sumerlaeia bacterium]
MNKSICITKKSQTAFLLLILLIFTTGLLNAQFTQQSFEEPQSKFELLRKQGADKINAVFVTDSEIPADPMGGNLAGTTSIKLLSKDQAINLFVAIPESLTRSQIAEAGAVVYSADLYLPAPGTPFPTANLAVYGAKSKSDYAMYRFGITENRELLYFSFNDGINPSSRIYHQQAASNFNLRQPGWNRFQIMVTGKGLIVCAVNGQETEFSPLAESTLDDLGVGVTVNKSTMDVPVFADNFMITAAPQMTIPKFPSNGQPEATSNSAEIQSSIQMPTVEIIKTTNAAATINWLNDPSNAWKVASEQKKPLIIYFTNSAAPTHSYFFSMLQENSELSSLLSENVTAMLNINESVNQDHALKFQIYQFPTLFILGTNGKEKAKITLFVDESTPSSIAESLREALN